MSVKVYNKVTKQWEIFPGTMGAPGKDAYLIAHEHGYPGTPEEYTETLLAIPDAVDKVENADYYPMPNSDKVVKSGGTYELIKNVDDRIDVLAASIPDEIKASIVDNLTTTATDLALSANQGKILKDMISNIKSWEVKIYSFLPATGEDKILYLIPKTGIARDIYDEYIWVNGDFERIGGSSIDLSQYYTKTQTDGKISDAVSASEADVKTWVGQQGYIKTASWRPVHTPDGTLTDNTSPLVLEPYDESVDISMEDNKVIFQSHTLVADENNLGGIKLGFEDEEYPENIPVKVDIYDKAYVTVDKAAVVSALNYTPAKSSDIPTKLPNPNALNVTTGGVTVSYDGSAAKSLNFDLAYAKQMPYLTNPNDAGLPGIYFGDIDEQFIDIAARVTKENPNASVVVRGNATVSLIDDTYQLAEGVEELLEPLEGELRFKRFNLTWVGEYYDGAIKKDVVLVEGYAYKTVNNLKK